MAKRHYIRDSSPASHPLLLKHATFRLRLPSHFVGPDSLSSPAPTTVIARNISL
jgi:hypothetical protein